MFWIGVGTCMVPLPFIKEKYKTLDKWTALIMFYRQ